MNPISPELFKTVLDHADAETIENLTHFKETDDYIHDIESIYERNQAHFFIQRTFLNHRQKTELHRRNLTYSESFVHYREGYLFLHLLSDWRIFSENIRKYFRNETMPNFIKNPPIGCRFYLNQMHLLEFIKNQILYLIDNNPFSDRYQLTRSLTLSIHQELYGYIWTVRQFSKNIQDNEKLDQWLNRLEPPEHLDVAYQKEEKHCLIEKSTRILSYLNPGITFLKDLFQNIPEEREDKIYRLKTLLRFYIINRKHKEVFQLLNGIYNESILNFEELHSLIRSLCIFARNFNTTTDQLQQWADLHLNI